MADKIEQDINLNVNTGGDAARKLAEIEAGARRGSAAFDKLGDSASATSRAYQNLAQAAKQAATAQESQIASQELAFREQGRRLSLAHEKQRTNLRSPQARFSFPDKVEEDFKELEKRQDAAANRLASRQESAVKRLASTGAFQVGRSSATDKARESVETEKWIERGVMNVRKAKKKEADEDEKWIERGIANIRKYKEREAKEIEQAEAKTAREAERNIDKEKSAYEKLLARAGRDEGKASVGGGDDDGDGDGKGGDGGRYGRGRHGAKGFFGAAKSLITGPSGQRGGPLSQVGFQLGTLGIGTGSAVLGPAGIVVGSAVVGIGLASVAAKSLAASLEHLGDTTKTAAQQAEGFRESLPLIGEVFKSFREFREALDGTANALRRNAMSAELEALKQNLTAGLNLRVAGVVHNLDAARASALGARTPLTPYQRFDRSTVAGERASQEYQQRYPAIQQYDAARSGVVTAAASEAAQRRRVVVAEQREEDARAKLGIAGRRLETEVRLGNADMTLGADDERKVQLADTRAKYIQAEVNYQNALKAGDHERQTLLERQNDTAKAGLALDKAKVDLDKADLAILKDRYERSASTQQQLGSMGRGEFEQARAAARYVRQVGPGGFENIPREYRELARQVVPDYIRKLSEEAGGQRTKELLGEGFDLREKELAKEIAPKLENLEAKVSIDIKLNEQKMADAVVASLKTFLDTVIVKLVQEANSRLREQSQKQIQAQQK